MSRLDKILVHVDGIARRGSIALTVHQAKYGYVPRWDFGPDGEVRILDCSLPVGQCPPREPRGENVIAAALKAARERAR